LVWTVTHNGRSDRAVGWLAPFYEFDNTVLRAQRSGSQRMSTPEELAAKPPSIEREGSETVEVAVDAPLNLAVLVKDDGLPGPAKMRRPSSEDSGVAALSAVLSPPRPSMPEQDMVSARSAAPTGLALTWLHYRGTGNITCEPMTVPLDSKGGRASTIARFSAPGTYVVRAVANDQIFMTPINVTVHVTASRGR